ncbi:uncharacterized protein L969DRAFT_87937 [Mixia osmundae IAM 14324]|uniref:Nuclear pore complex protein Nup85 n=1 Tax=Mixia osmundae (strain CBS 9802 / IAM 14324 / JCM 22182 / KY 12970) TaxID=764103 RepID=G7E201_MIXOS|nr:uncharacterized protein L969DRAFT_87937 [Mixia osmundae IAM 14324]KEI38703.1 hypothetical protein L969DRAFT_87937 [Mixia osmundae IAM 14324]GAA96838.1 hypothetical protein E5Q_03511 [Mixia osmundae IAM 14324]
MTEPGQVIRLVPSILPPAELQNSASSPSRSAALQAFTASGRSFATAFDPFRNELACFVSAKDGHAASTTTLSATPTDDADQRIYFLAYDGLDSADKRLFVTQSYTHFVSLQGMAELEQQDGQYDGLQQHSSGIPEADTITRYARIAALYCADVQAHIDALSAMLNEPSGRKNADRIMAQLGHYQQVYDIFKLASILYIPADGRGDGLLTEEYLNWLNYYDPAPSTEEGASLKNMSTPWEDPKFWSYTYRSVLRGMPAGSVFTLRRLRDHPKAFVSSTAKLAISLVDDLPRSTRYKLESAYSDAFRLWRNRVTDSLKRLDRDYEATWSGPEDEGEDWLLSFRLLYEILAGDQDRVLEASEDVPEALGAWGLLVRPTLRRDHIVETMRTITATLEMEPAGLSDEIIYALLNNDVAEAIQCCGRLDAWLVAHLTDLFEKMGLLEAAPQGPSLRDWFILRWADCLRSDDALWRIALDYLSACGEAGRARMSETILRTAFQDKAPASKAEDESMATGGLDDASVEALLQACTDYSLEAETRKICQGMAERRTRQRRYGEAVAFSVRAGDAKRIARIADTILDLYVVDRDAFNAQVDSIPTSLLHPEAAQLRPGLFPAEMQDEDYQPAQLNAALFASRLSFIARYRQFHSLYAQGDKAEAATLLISLFGLAPKRFWAVMFVDAVPLLESEASSIMLRDCYQLLGWLEQIDGGSHTSKDPYGYLNMLASLSAGKMLVKPSREEVEAAQKRLLVVRFALARHLSRSSTVAR